MTDRIDGEGPDGRSAVRRSRHQIAEPESREAWAPSDGRPAVRIPDGKPPKVAVLVVHGMGQQIRFQTLDQVELGLRAAEAATTGVPPDDQPPSVARLVQLGAELLPRLEISLGTRDGARTDVHLYEAYWAPITEGRVTLRDVISFLWRGGRHGLRQGLTEFWRWMFGHRVVFGTRPGTTFALVLALGVVGSLIVLNAVVGAVGTAVLAGRGRLGWPSHALLLDLTQTIACFLVLIALLGALALGSRWMGWFYAALGGTLLAGAAGVVMVAWHRFRAEALWPLDLLRPLPPVARSAVLLVLWAALLWLGATVRGLLIQYAGDVVAYVSPHYLDRFAEIREAIKESVARTAGAVYTARAADGGFEYGAVAVVGHSLGSVVAYDTLNGLINRDRLSGHALRVTERTRLFLTFGSPLDKTAFVFGLQGDGTTESREALAALKQPLIQDYAWRPFPWVNVYSRADIISGSLEFYDDASQPLGAGRQVRNLEDPEASTPLYAHVQYWRTGLVFRTLHQALVPR